MHTPQIVDLNIYTSHISPPTMFYVLTSPVKYGVKQNPFVQIYSLSNLPGIHRDLCGGDAFQAYGYGSILLLPGGLELF